MTNTPPLRSAPEYHITTDDLRAELFGEVSPVDRSTCNQENPERSIDSTTSSLLAKFTLTGDSEILTAQLSDLTYVLGCLAIRGQWTVLYSAPNTGKTLLTLHLLSRSLTESPSISPGVFYINADDNLNGIVEKTKIAEEFSFNLIVPGFKGFEIKKLQSFLVEICNQSTAKEHIIIIDTLKKAVDLMKKSRLRDFGEVVRRFVSQGGTFIALAHTNKKKNADGKSIPEGTGDILNDADCAYVLDEVKRNNSKKTVKLTCIKHRGGAPDSLYFRYSTEPDLQYSDLLASVDQLSEDELDNFEREEEFDSENAIIAAIKNAIAAGHDTKMRIRDFAAENCNASRRRVLQILEMHTGKEPGIHLWDYTRGERGRLTYTCLPEFQIPSFSEDSTK